MVAPERKKRFPFSMVKSWNTKTTREMTEKMMERIMKACTALSASVDKGQESRGVRPTNFRQAGHFPHHMNGQHRIQ